MPVNLSKDSNGWSIIPAHTNGVDIYVDPNATGSGTGESWANAFTDLTSAAQEVTDGQDDHIILKENSLITSGRLNDLRGKEGPAPENPIIVYTENWDVNGAAAGRAHVQVDADFFRIVSTSSDLTQNIAIIGVERSQPNYDGSVRFPVCQFSQRPTTNILFEDCYFHDCYNSIVGISQYSGPTILDIDFRRCTIYRNYADDTAHCQGIATSGYRNLNVFECDLIHNGFHPTHKESNQFDRNIYASTTAVATDTVEKCLLLEGASEVQLRSGGMFKRNLIERTPWTLDMGFGHSGPSDANGSWNDAGFDSTISECVMIDSIDEEERGIKGQKLNLSGAGSTKTVLMKDCIMARDSNSSGTFGGLEFWFFKDSGTVTRQQILDRGFHNVTIDDCIIDKLNARAIQGHFDASRYDSPQPTNATVSNVVVKNCHLNTRSTGHLLRMYGSNAVTWQGNTYSHDNKTDIDTSAIEIDGTAYSLATFTTSIDATGTTGRPNYVDDSRNLASYASTIGVGSTRDDLITAILANRKANYRTDLKAEAIIDYIRAGYGKSALGSGPPPPSGPTRLPIRIVISP